MNVEDGLVLELVPAEAPGNSVFGPDDLAPYFEPGRLQGILEFPPPGRRMADVQGGARFHSGPAGAERSFEKLLEVGVRHSIAFDLQTFLGIAFVVNVVRR